MNTAAIERSRSAPQWVWNALGLMGTAIALLASGAVAYGNLTASIAVMRRDIDQNERRIEKTEVSSDDLKEEIASMNVRLEVLIREVQNVSRKLGDNP